MGRLAFRLGEPRPFFDALREGEALRFPRVAFFASRVLFPRAPDLEELFLLATVFLMGVFPFPSYDVA